MESDSFRLVCKILAGLSIVGGTLGMPMSFLYLASSGMENITAGASGFIAGAILIGSGVVSFSLLASTEGPRREKQFFSQDAIDQRFTKED